MVRKTRTALACHWNFDANTIDYYMDELRNASTQTAQRCNVSTLNSRDAASRLDEALGCEQRNTALVTGERHKRTTSRGSSGSELTSRSRHGFFEWKSCKSRGIRSSKKFEPSSVNNVYQDTLETLTVFCIAFRRCSPSSPERASCLVSFFSIRIFFGSCLGDR